MTISANLVALARRSIIGAGSLISLDANGRLPASTSWDVVIEDRQALGTQGGASIAGWQDRTLNTVVINTIGASLSGNKITLPAGTYDVEILIPAFTNVSASAHAILYNITDNSNAGAQGSNIVAGQNSFVYMYNRIIMPSPKELKLQMYHGASVGTYGLGQAYSIGNFETYSRFRARKVA